MICPGFSLPEIESVPANFARPPKSSFPSPPLPCPRGHRLFDSFFFFGNEREKPLKKIEVQKMVFLGKRQTLHRSRTTFQPRNPLHTVSHSVSHFWLRHGKVSLKFAQRHPYYLFTQQRSPPLLLFLPWTTTTPFYLLKFAVELFEGLPRGGAAVAAGKEFLGGDEEKKKKNPSTFCFLVSLLDFIDLNRAEE